MPVPSPSVAPASDRVGEAPQDAGQAVAGTTEVRLRRGETLMDVLARRGVSVEQVDEAVRVLRPVFDPRRLQVGQVIGVETATAEDGGRRRRLVALAIETGPVTTVRLGRDEAGALTARETERPLRRETVRIAAPIPDSFHKAARRAALPPAALKEMVRILSWDVDFQREVRPGDRFEALLERVTTEEGRPVRDEGLAFVGLDLRERRIAAYRFTPDDGSAGYFDADGRALRKRLLRTPVDGARLSSGFGPRRHPILGFTRMHKGIDFAAPAGTPVFAAGDGEVEFVGRNRGHGKYVRLRHNAEYGTAYAHLARFGAGLKVGGRVSQGQVIGYVGSTGLSTGPHLHYEVLSGGRPVNPLALKEQAFAEALAGSDLARFRRVRAEVDALRGGLGGGQVVAQRD